jgi:DNA-binding response OmpR family regulator
MKILLAEDEYELSRALVAILKHNGHDADAAMNGEEALRLGLDNNYDAFVLDIMMPKLDGLAVLKELRKQNVKSPVIMLTAKAEYKDKILGLDLGADDYLTKPFQANELLARLRAVHRRNTDYLMKTCDFSDVTFSRVDKTISKSQASFSLNQKEAAILEAFMPCSKASITKEQLAEHLELDGDDNIDSRIEVYTAYINNKFKALSSKLRLKGDRLQGYRLEE